MGSSASTWLGLSILSALFLTTYGGCQFPASWTGRWFQGGEGLTYINSTYIGSKGECVQNQGDKYITYEKTEKCYRCIVINEKHPNVLQYKETLYCMDENSLEELCRNIFLETLFSLFRVEGAVPIPCPFRSPPFSFSYNGGKSDCIYPPSRADSCTDDSRLVFRYAACPDVLGSQSTVEEMLCLATWKDGSNKYLVAKMEHKLTMSDEEKYRCFIYDRINHSGGGTVYQIAQSGDATCNGIQNSVDGSKTMKLTRLETQHERCKFPAWVVDHHHWHSLDFAHSYHFSHKNATLRVTSDRAQTETRLICYKVISNTLTQFVLVAHVTTGCESGYVCMVFYQRDAHVIQVHRSNEKVQEPSEACSPGYLDMQNLPSPVTLVTASLPPLPCPNPGRYGILRPQTKTVMTIEVPTKQMVHCNEENAFDLLAIGCNSPPDTMEFHSTCPDEPSIGYSCHGSWAENSTTYVVVSPASRKSTDAKHYCFVFTQKLSQMTLHRVAESCFLPSHQITWSFNLTSVGKCTESSASKDYSNVIFPSVVCLVATTFLIITLR
ncbi:uncharacterized protein LOC142323154 [Lycorma delicatula]|uniref:uncharacterized protein LOC142323154 n=1 Tax=Lycorma delicatula TaxID=130591 RepID=UPI003F51441A